MAGGYVGTAEDKRRIARQEKEREEAKKKFEDAKNVTTQGLREFGTGTSEVGGARRRCRAPGDRLASPVCQAAPP